MADGDRARGGEGRVPAAEQDRHGVRVDVGDRGVGASVQVEVRGLGGAGARPDPCGRAQEVLEAPVPPAAKDAQVRAVLVHDREIQRAVAVEIRGQAAVGPRALARAGAGGHHLELFEVEGGGRAARPELERVPARLEERSVLRPDPLPKEDRHHLAGRPGAPGPERHRAVAVPELVAARGRPAAAPEGMEGARADRRAIDGTIEPHRHRCVRGRSQRVRGRLDRDDGERRPGRRGAGLAAAGRGQEQQGEGQGARGGMEEVRGHGAAIMDQRERPSRPVPERHRRRATSLRGRRGRRGTSPSALSATSAVNEVRRLRASEGLPSRGDRRGVDGRRDADGVVDVLLGQPAREHHLLVRAHAVLAAVDGAHRQAEQLEVDACCEAGWARRFMRRRAGFSA